jgi:hypothetical protein
MVSNLPSRPVWWWPDLKIARPEFLVGELGEKPAMNLHQE